MKNFLLPILLIYSLSSFAQELSWARGLGDDNKMWNNQGNAIQIDAQSNVYTLGSFFSRGIVDSPTGNDTLYSAGSQELFLTKYKAGGDLIWARSLGSGIQDAGIHMTIDASANLYIVGYIEDTVDFDWGIPTVLGNSTIARDIFFAKYDKDGTLIFAKVIEGGGIDTGAYIKLDDYGNIYITGGFYNSIDLNPNPFVTYSITSNGSQDFFLAKYDPFGNFVWANHYGGIGFDVGGGIDIAPDGNIYIVGTFNETVDFDPDPSQAFFLTSNGGFDAFFAKYDSAGNYIWAGQIGASDFDDCTTLAVNSLGEVYIAGYFHGIADFAPSPLLFSLLGSDTLQHAFLAKYDQNANLIWANAIEGTQDCRINRMTFDTLERPLVLGMFKGTTDFDPSSNSTTHTSTNQSDDIFFALYDELGNFEWVRAIGGPGPDAGRDLLMSPQGSIHMAGDFSLTADFEPDTGIVTLTTVNFSNAFVAKFGTITDEVLPVSLVSFELLCNNTQPELHWTVSNAYQRAYTAIERAIVGQTFEEIHRINVPLNQEFAQYTYTDPSPPNKPHVYRLRFVDINGATTYSNILESFCESYIAPHIIALHNSQTQSIQLHSPIPPSDWGSLKVVDISGRSIAQFHHHLPPSIPTSNWSKGIYILEGTLISGERFHQRIIITP